MYCRKGIPPQTPEKSTPRRILKRLLHLCLEGPVRGSPYFDRPVIRLGRKELAHWVPTHALDETLVLVELP